MLCGIEHIDIERKSRLGLLGELLAEEWLPAAGFKDVENLNRKVRNCPFGDILATRNGTRFFIGVKSRNEFQANGRINPTYNAVLIRADKKAQLEGAGKTEAQITEILWREVQALAERWQALPAWTAVAMRPLRGTFCAYFGLATALGNRRSIPMKIADRRRYEVLAEHRSDHRITPDLLNRTLSPSLSLG
jgi:hypothetical protein